MTTLLYPSLEKKVEDEWVKLDRNQITPWAFLTAGPPFRCRDFYGNDISYEGVEFEGSPRSVFWSRYIEPFLEDIALRLIKETCLSCEQNRLPAEKCLNELRGLLRSLVRRAYDRMAVIDQRLRGKGYPERAALRSTDAEARSMEAFIDRHIQAEQAMLTSRSKLRGPIVSWYTRPIGILFLGVIASLIAAAIWWRYGAS